jgi:hypothetical protein
LGNEDGGDGNQAHTRAVEIAKALVAEPAAGLSGFACKTFLLVHALAFHHRGDDPSAGPAVDTGGSLGYDLARGLLLDIEHLAPGLAPLIKAP